MGGWIAAAWHGVFGGCRRWLGALRDPEGRRGAALIFAAGGGIAFTAYAGYALFMVRTHPHYVFYLGIGGLILVAIVHTGLMGLLVTRSIKGSILGNEFEITDQAAQVAGIAAKAAAEAVAATPPPPPAPPPVDEAPPRE